MSEPVRLNKWIAQMGLASRREADRLIAQGRVRVNGSVVTEMGHKVDPEADAVEVDLGGLAPRTYVALHKPAGYVSLAKPLRRWSRPWWRFRGCSPWGAWTGTPRG
jgi:23S rRNA pseudouridine2605 synthase